MIHIDKHLFFFKMEKDKLIDLLFAKNDSLENKLEQFQAAIERQGVEFEEQMKSLQSQLRRMEERAIAAERRAEDAERRKADLIAALKVMMDGSAIKELKVRKSSKCN